MEGACVGAAATVSPLRGLLSFRVSTHGLRRGLHSSAASRLLLDKTTRRAEGDCLPRYFVTFYAVWISQGEASDVMQS